MLLVDEVVNKDVAVNKHQTVRIFYIVSNPREFMFAMNIKFPAVLS